MPFRFACPECGIETLVEDEFAGHTGPCAGCGKQITVPYLPANAAKSGEHVEPRATRWSTLALITVSSILAALLVFGSVVWLGFPFIRRATSSVQAARCQSNLRRIAAAIRQYEVDHNSLPCAYVSDVNGKPMHSWRVLILPQLGEHGLFNRYRFDEPWDGPNNIQLVSAMPDVFACPSDDDALLKGESSYMVLVGPNTLFPAQGAIPSTTIRDDPTQTILVAETPVAGIVWTEPKDLDATRMKFAVNGSASGEVGSWHRSEGAYVATADGTVHFVDNLFPEEYLKGMSTTAGGEDIPMESLD